MDDHFPQRLIRPRDLAAFVGLKPSRVRELVSMGAFPKPIRLSAQGRSIAWLSGDLIRWQRERIAARDAALVDAALIGST